MAMVLSCHPSMSLLQLMLFSLLLLAGLAMSLPLQPAMNHVRWQVDKVNQRGHSLGLVMSYIDEATALEASSYFTPWRVLPFLDLHDMDPLAEFNLFEDEVGVHHHQVDEEPPAAAPGQQNNGQPARLIWTPLMSAHILEKFSDLVATGVRIDKGFKDHHLHAVAKDLSNFINQPVTNTQIYNHLRKWRTKWVKICRLKDLSGANWDEDNCMITMDPQHYQGHVLAHSKDAEFLNVPIINYTFMQNIFGGGVATSRFAMGSNEALGQPPADEEIIDLEQETRAAKKMKQEAGTSKGNKGKEQFEDFRKEKKRKKALSEDDVGLLQGMRDAVAKVGAAISEGNHNEACPGIYEAVMAVPGLAKSDLMVCLNYLMKNKETALVFVGMKVEDQALWMAHHLAEARAKMASQ